jgi:hypothetical protein
MEKEKSLSTTLGYQTALRTKEGSNRYNRK